MAEKQKADIVNTLQLQQYISELSNEASSPLFKRRGFSQADKVRCGLTHSNKTLLQQQIQSLAELSGGRTLVNDYYECLSPELFQ